MKTACGNRATRLLAMCAHEKRKKYIILRTPCWWMEQITCTVLYDVSYTWHTGLAAGYKMLVNNMVDWNKIQWDVTVTVVICDHSLCNSVLGYKPLYVSRPQVPTPPMTQRDQYNNSLFVFHICRTLCPKSQNWASCRQIRPKSKK